jgi:hypothetical protein
MKADWCMPVVIQLQYIIEGVGEVSCENYTAVLGMAV